MRLSSVITLVLVWSSSPNPCHGWSASTPPQTTTTTTTPSTTALARPIRHVAVIGAGIAGLSVAHALLHNNNNDNQVTVDLYDARPALNSANSGGAGVQLNGGLVALGRIHPTLREAVYRAGLPQIAVESWSHTATATNNSSSSSKERLLQLDLPRIVRAKPTSAGCRILLEKDDNNNNNNNNNNNKVNEQQPQPPGRRLWWISIMRAALQQTLLDQLVLFQRPRPTKEPSGGFSAEDRPRLRVQWGKQLLRLQTNEDDEQQQQQLYTCHFADGTQSDQPYDLVVDASGINSVTRRYIQNPQRLRQTNDNDEMDMDNRKTAIYSGIRIRYAVVDGKPGEDTTSASFSGSSSNGGVRLRQHFGRAAYALSGIYGTGEGQPPARCAFIVYLDPNAWGPFGKRQQQQPSSRTSSKSSSTKQVDDDDENVDWSQDNRAPSLERARRDMLDQLEASGISVNTTELGQYIAQADRFFELGSYFHNPFHKWSSREGRLVLCGDAAHALPPFLGQGANQAIQDAYCLVQQLYAYNAAVEEYNTNVNNALSLGETATTKSTDTGNEQPPPPPPPPQLHNYLKAYEQTRWPSTFAVFWKSVFLGYLETGGFDGVYAKFRDGFFKAMGWVGVAERVLLDAATPKLGDE